MKTTLNDKALAGLLGILVLLVGIGPAAAVPEMMADYGDQMAWRGADINAMGGTGVAVYRGALNNVYNPAMLTAGPQSGRLDLSMSLDQAHEDRFQPLFDSFNSYVADAAIASNREHYWQSGFGIVGSLPGRDAPVRVGLSLVDRYPFNYTFREEIRNPNGYPPDPGQPARDQIIESREREVRGTLRTLSLGVGADVDDEIAIGMAVHYGFGKREETRLSRDFFTTDGDDGYTTTTEYDMDGVSFSLGARGKISERVEIGLAWESQLNTKGDYTRSHYTAASMSTVEETWDGSLRYPNVFRGGLVLRPRTDPRTVFTAEVEYLAFSELIDSQNPGYENPQNLQDVTDVRIGVEHMFYNGTPLRFGFRRFDSYRDPEAGCSVFTAGTDFGVGRGRVAFSVELGKITSVRDHQFAYPADYLGDNYVVDPQARVEDTRFRVGVGYTQYF
ncbi:hypothetical protein CSA17_03320 [bacterium DOLJORAL78_65_58]|nr:MAG: hypothetical protein CSB20_09635 [bacterium DOLZORAL124_64_63]PIE76230.1 MAG: hypothetical protein CSA17_03320 [bacterium DOLJORAL78_65_58]